MNGYTDKRSAPRLFLSGDAARHGISEWKLRVPEPTERVMYGIRADPNRQVTRVAPEWADEEWDRMGLRLRALQLKYPQVAASHASAGVLYGLPLPSGSMDGQLHVSVDDRNLRIRRPGVVLHRVSDFQRTNVFGHQLMTGPSLFLQFAASLDVPSLVMIGDAMIGRWHGPRLCTLPQLRGHFTSRKSVKNRRRVEEALALIRPDVDSPKETELRLWIISAGLPEPEVHPRIFCEQLNTAIRPDLGYVAARLAIEYESDFHRTDARQWNLDIDRENALEHEGWALIRVTSRTDRRRLERQIRAHLERAHLTH
ncbi:hypothetical protein [Brevibacterium renqingii]|uniref:hypothetical protein n=1 Tax=Brevibacterium renqingii TaxID=2776916 RepID=UPI001ADFC17C|nr:hypothetical protein [Brevibacterium renqingii]